MAYEDQRYALGFVERILREEFGHGSEEAEAYTKAFYHAAKAGEVFPVRWSDDDICHEGAGLAYYVQYHMTGARRLKAATPQFFRWRAACNSALAARTVPPAVPSQDEEA